MPPCRMVASNQTDEIAKLAGRQFAILAWAAFGKTNQEIEMILELGRNTIERDFAALFETLNVEHRMHAVELFLTWAQFEKEGTDSAPDSE